MVDFFDSLLKLLTDYILVICLLLVAVYFTYRTKGVQFTMFPEMIKLLKTSSEIESASSKEAVNKKKAISSFQAFVITIGGRVGVGNLAGVTSAIVLGGPGAVFWMWMVALIGSSSAFIESTLGQLFKIKTNDRYLGGPAYYILKGTGCKVWAIAAALLVCVTFGLASNAVQCGVLSEALKEAFDVPAIWTAVFLCGISMAIICGGMKSIARFCEILVPIMAGIYILMALYVMTINVSAIPVLFGMIFKSAFGIQQIGSGVVGAGIAIGVRRGLYSNEAGEGSAPNVAATASVSHPVKQGLMQTLAVFADTLLICSATAFIVLCDGHWTTSADGIALTQNALDSQLGIVGFGKAFVSIALIFFVITTLVAQYYYGEINIFLLGKHRKKMIYVYRIIVGATIFVASIRTAKELWVIADITMALMTICNLAALIVLGKYAIACLNDYKRQLKAGKDPVYHSSTIPEIADETECWS